MIQWKSTPNRVAEVKHDNMINVIKYNAIVRTDEKKNVVANASKMKENGNKSR